MIIWKVHIPVLHLDCMYHHPISLLEIAHMHKTGHPVLLGTTSMEQSEALSKQLTEASIPHQVLNTNLENAE
ncbi:unnamed protein product [Sphagnum troendelagicum]|uniref:SecA family profile domain-containing protein n=1 Tax=Sphagnum troendelagicum TaxID=128251 RepID=A0ABP0UB93_9BRYO